MMESDLTVKDSTKTEKYN